MPREALDFDTVREIARTLPEITESESTRRGAPSLKARGRLLTCPAIHKSAEPNSLVVKIGFDQRAKLIKENPDVYYVTDHYVNYPSVLVRMSRIRRDALRVLLGMAWLFVSKEVDQKRPAVRQRGIRQGVSR